MCILIYKCFDFLFKIMKSKQQRVKKQLKHRERNEKTNEIKKTKKNQGLSRTSNNSSREFALRILTERAFSPKTCSAQEAKSFF